MNPSPAHALHHALRAAIQNREAIWSPDPGRHEINGAFLPERFCHVSNNDHGLKRVLFDLEGAEDLILDGQGAELIFFGEVLPIRVGRSRNIAIKNLTIDWRRPFFTQATVIDSGAGWLTFQSEPSDYPLRSDGGRLIAHDAHGWQTDALWNLLPFHPESREVCTKQENWHLSRWHRATDLGGGTFRVEADFRETYTEGTPIVLMHGNRVAPGIWIEESDGVRLENVTIHHAPGMGVVGQLSRDVSIDHVRVVPSGDRLFSSWVDAFHLVDCDGATRIENCEARGQFDDALNIHGNFSKVVARLDSRRLRIQTVHPQRFGRNAATPGTGLAIYRHSNMERLFVTRVSECSPLNQEFCDILLEDPLPENVCGNLVVSRHNPESSIEIRNCSFGANRGRGCLLNIEHRTLVERCHFHVSGHGIESVPDANYWWEGPPALDLTIRGNHFENCGFGPCGSTLIKAGPEFPDGADPRAGALRDTAAGQTAQPASEHPVLGRVTIADNTIVHPAGKVIETHNVEHLEFSENRITSSLRGPR